MGLSKLENETLSEYIYRVGSSKDIGGYTWEDIRIVANREFDVTYSESKYRKQYNKMISDKMATTLLSTEDDFAYNEVVDEYNDLKDKIATEKIKLSDYVTQNRANVRLEARYDSLKSLALEVAETLNKNNPFVLKECKNNNKLERAGILAIGDWHYGLEYDGYWNKYNPDICKERVTKLFDNVMNIIEKEKISNLVVVNMGDMISGNIHLQLRISSRLDVVTQTIEVSEILAEFLAKLSQYVRVDYYSMTDNHSRIDPNKANSFRPESFARFIDWHLRYRLDNIVNFSDNDMGDDIVKFSLWDHTVIAVHGDRDPQKGIIDKLNGYNQEHIDLILSAHLHHFSADESNYTETFCIGSLCGTDDYAAGLRLNSKPSQLMLISTPEDVTACIYKIKLD